MAKFKTANGVPRCILTGEALVMMYENDEITLYESMDAVL